LVAGSAALTIAGSSLVYAQQPRGFDGREQRGFERGQQWRPSPEDMAAFAEARIAGLKAGLRLTPEQEKNWPAFEAAARDFAKQRRERRETFLNQTPAASPVERLRRGADMLASASASMKRLADAQEPLYNSLDENQKRRFAMLNRFGGGMGRGFNRPGWHERWQNWRRTEWRRERGTNSDATPTAPDRI